MSHCDIHHECTRREPIIFSAWQDDIILDLDVTPFIASVHRQEIGKNFFKKKKSERPMLFLLPMRALGKFKQAFLRQRGAQARSWPAA
jgi:hypothetical protein